MHTRSSNFQHGTLKLSKELKHYLREHPHPSNPGLLLKNFESYEKKIYFSFKKIFFSCDTTKN